MWKQHQMFDTRNFCFFFACSHVWVKFWKASLIFVWSCLFLTHRGDFERKLVWDYFETQHISWGKSGMLGLCLFWQMNPQGNQWTMGAVKILLGPGWRITHLKSNIGNNAPRKQQKSVKKKAPDWFGLWKRRWKMTPFYPELLAASHSFIIQIQTNPQPNVISPGKKNKNKKWRNHPREKL